MARTNGVGQGRITRADMWVWEWDNYNIGIAGRWYNRAVPEVVIVPPSPGINRYFLRIGRRPSRFFENDDQAFRSVFVAAEAAVRRVLKSSKNAA